MRGAGIEDMAERRRGDASVTEIIICCDSGDGRTSALFEDNGDVAYCYILVDGTFRSDVWVYNRKPAPLGEPWKEGVEPPYLNPAGYALEMEALPSSAADVSIEWRTKAHDSPVALVKIGGRLSATVSAHCKPGCARLARRPGPLAKMLVEG